MDEHDALNARLASGVPTLDVRKVELADKPSTPQQNAPTINFALTQWSAEFNDTFRPMGPAVPKLPSAVYRFEADQRGLYMQKVNVLTDHLIELDDSASIRVIRGIRKFWASKAEYTKRGVIYKRGVLLWGPAGSGKTATLAMLMKDLIATGGIVVFCENPEYAVIGLQALRRIEPERPLIVVLEDIDEIMRRYGEHALLALLDGEHQIANVVNIATTNYPERLGARIVNRPSRFDERILVDMPSPKARARYLLAATDGENMGMQEIDRWVKDTDGFSIAHLRELVVAVFCLKQEYADVVERLSKMRVQPKSGNEWGGNGPAGFGKQMAAWQAMPAQASGRG